MANSTAQLNRDSQAFITAVSKAGGTLCMEANNQEDQEQL